MKKYKCPKCKTDITTMKNLYKPHKWSWMCSTCNTNVSEIKLEQLAENLKILLNK